MSESGRALGWRKGFERVSLALGLTLLAVYAVAMIDRSAGSNAAIRSINVEHAAAVPEKEVTAGHNTGEAFGVLSIGRLGIKAPVFDSTDELALNRGLGWIAGTAKPGEPGNSGIAGHRDGFFRPLKDVAVGDAVELRTREVRFTYRVDRIEIVHPDNVGVLRSRDAMTLTLVTCYPFYFVGDAPRRFVVHAKLENQAAINSVRGGGSRNTEAALLISQGAIQ